MALRLRAALNRSLFTNIRRHFKTHRNDSGIYNESDVYEQNIHNGLQPRNQTIMKTIDLIGKSNEKIDAERKMYIKHTKGTNLRKYAFLSNMSRPSQLGSYRSFSYDKDSDECRGRPQVGRKKCQKFDICDCDQSEDTSCKKMPLFPPCKKRVAPYPSFSEACYEEPYNKPSECKMCPWKPMDNPNPTFKHKTKGYHTAANLNQNFKPYKKSTLLEKKPLERMLLRLLSDKATNQKPEDNETYDQKKSSLDPIISRTLDGGNDAVKSYLYQPTYKSPGKAKRDTAKKAEITESVVRDMKLTSAGIAVCDRSKCDGANCKCALCSKIAASCKEKASDAMLMELSAIPFIELPNFYAFATKDEKERCKPTCVKFPFKPCNFDRGTGEMKRPRATKCPKLPHRFHRKVVDCPADPNERKSCVGYLMTARWDKDGCPIVDRTKCEDYKKPDCPKKDIKTHICPTEPLIKKVGYQPLKKPTSKTEDKKKKAMDIPQDSPIILLEQKVESVGVPIVIPTARVEPPTLRAHIETSQPH